MNRAYSLLTVKAVEEDQRIITGMATTPATDRMGDIVEPMGVKFKNPLPLLHQHRSDSPVGTVRFKKPTEDGIEFEARLPKIEEPGPLKDRVDTAWQEVKAGLVRGVSIGFRPVEYSFMDDGGIRFMATEVLELSLVTIPANVEATIQQIRSVDAQQRAATGKTRSADITPPAPGKKTKPVVRAQEGTKVKTIQERIKDFEASRVAKATRMDEIQNKASEDGRTKDSAEKEEFDTLRDEIKSIDEELADLRDMERLNVQRAQPVDAKAIDDPHKAAESRAGVRVESVKANLPKGISFTRYALALARAKGNRMEAYEIAKANKNWHDQTPEVETVLKAAVAAGTTTDSGWAAPLVEYQVMTSEFIEYLRPRTIIGRITGLRNVPFKVKVPRQTAVASVNWVGEGKPKPVGRGTFDSVTLDHFKIAGIIVLTEELVRLSNPSAEALAREDLAGGIIQLMDQDFIDPEKAASAGVSPASVTYGVTPRAATGTEYSHLSADVRATMDNFLAANITPDFVLMSQAQALSFSLMENSLGQLRFPNLTMNGGTFLGLPTITSQNIPDTEDSPQEGKPIIFGRAEDIMLADEGQVMIDVSREASLQMDGAPDDPATASTVLVSLWQHNMVGIRAERMINWAKRRSAAVQFISAAKYA